MILLIDNYDSFTFNLYQYVGELGYDVKVVRNDKFNVEDIEKWDVSHIILSPGPGHPKDAGLCLDVIRRYQGKIPILGVCLGHQAIGMVYGGTISFAKHKMHGKISEIEHSESKIFKNIQNPCKATRYHSLVVDRESFPKELKITAWSKEGEIMALEHCEYPVYGIQFHPESVFTEEGKQMIKNFLQTS